MGITDAHVDDCHSCIPGHASKEGMSFLQQHYYLELMRWVSNETQRWFYEVNFGVRVLEMVTSVELLKIMEECLYQYYVIVTGSKD